MPKRTIAVLTGKRGGFGALITLCQAIKRHPDLKLELIVTDMHLSAEFGKTVREVEAWFKRPHRVDLKQRGDSGAERGKALGRAVIGFVDVLSKISPNILVTLGDRGEVLAACTAALELNIPVAHILGGDIAGNRDGIRIHAITKVAHLHFPANEDAYRRILRLGEEKWRVFNFGSTYIDLVMQRKYTPNSLARRQYGIGATEPYAICIQHPTTLDEKRSYAEAKAVFDAIRGVGIKTVAVWPCSDQGYRQVLRALGEYVSLPQFLVHKNIAAVDFWGLMAGASIMVGNSSSGLMETPYFNLPSVTVGHRQDGRARDTNVWDVPEPTANKVRNAINRALSGTVTRKLENHYVFGRGNAGARIAEVLRTVELGDSLLRKQMGY
jgi:UDP-N-acetylglucosamine 2-epimerase (non-hydrolysing)/GDP/UDP-N,N'-diacetylbacillosamine 2-epimerase (hydrolysing)